jgi:wyosine [tRNA(Phe)-imidazoG37] synthetase (radical SAM superfamily)
MTSSTLVQHHPRRFREFRYVYPVISRRSGGLSLGVNLSPDALCNFSCVYCQVLAEEDCQHYSRLTRPVDPEQLELELRKLIGLVQDGSLFHDEWFARTPPEKRAVRDIAFSGDGEPTLSPEFSEAVNRIANLRKELCPADTKIVLITNATTLHVQSVRNDLQTMLENNGEIWAKLDAGTPEYFRTISRSSIPYEKILLNLSEFSKEFPLVIQSCFLLLHGLPPTEPEILQYTERLKLFDKILRIQIYTVARSTPEPWVLPLSNFQLDSIAEIVQKITGYHVDAFYSS